MSGIYHRNPMPPLMLQSGDLLTEAVTAIAVLQERSLSNTAAVQNLFAIHTKSEDACNARFVTVHNRETAVDLRLRDLSHHVKALYDRIDRLEGKLRSLTNFAGTHGVKILLALALFLTLLPTGSIKTALFQMLGK